MKRILSLTIALAFAIAMTAGNNKQIERIRAIYNDVHEHIAMAEEEPMVTNQMSIDIDQMYPGSGPHKEHITFYFTCLDFSEEDQSEDGSINWQSDLKFVTQSFNIGAHEYYCEYLYDLRPENPFSPSSPMTMMRAARSSRYAFTSTRANSSRPFPPKSAMSGPPVSTTGSTTSST